MESDRLAKSPSLHRGKHAGDFREICCLFRDLYQRFRPQGPPVSLGPTIRRFEAVRPHA